MTEREASLPPSRLPRGDRMPAHWNAGPFRSVVAEPTRYTNEEYNAGRTGWVVTDPLPKHLSHLATSPNFITSRQLEPGTRGIARYVSTPSRGWWQVELLDGTVVVP